MAKAGSARPRALEIRDLIVWHSNKNQVRGGASGWWRAKLSRTGSAEVCWAARPARRIFHERALSLAPRSDIAHSPQAVAAAPAAGPRTTQCWAPGHPCSADIALVFGGRLHDWPPPRGQVSTRGGGRQGRCRSAGGTGSGSVNYNLRRPAVAAARSATSRRSPCARPCWRPLV